MYRSFLQSFRADTWNQIQPNCIWIHAASTGETKSVSRVIKRLHDKYSERYPLLVTNRSARAIDWPLSEVDSKCARVLAPNELRVGSFLRRSKPCISIFVESELWPVLIWRTRITAKCPMVLINGRMSDRSFQQWRSFSLPRMIVRFMLNCFDVIHAQSESDANRFRQLGWSRGEILVGNLKLVGSDRGGPGATYRDGEVYKFLNECRPGWAAISLHPGEEEVVLEAQALLASKLKNNEEMPNLIIVPRHPRTGGNKITRITETVYRIDAMNIVDMVCDWTKRGRGLVLVGGSLSQGLHHGGHNVLEPIRAHCKVMHGPHMSAFADLVNMIPHGRLRFEVDSPDTIVQRLMTAPKGSDEEVLEMDGYHREGEVILNEVCGHIERLMDTITVSS